MKKFLCLALSLLMLLPLMAALPLSASAADTTPSGQIWEGETDLMGYGGTGIKYNINGTDYEYVGGKPNKALTHLKSEVKLNYNSTVNPSRDHHTRFLPDNPKAWIEFTLDVKTAGEKNVYLQRWVGTESAKYKVTWRAEGVALENATVLAKEFDFYNSSWVYKEDNLGKITVTPGKYILRFECVGKNEAMKNTHYGMAIDYFELVGEDGVRRTQKRDTRGSDYDKVYYATDGAVRHIIWSMDVDEKTQENLDNGVYTKKIEKNNNMSCGGFAVGVQKLVLNGLQNSIGATEKPEYTVKFYVDKTGYYSVSAGMTNYKESSLVSFKINGDPVGEVVDQCIPDFNSASYLNLTPSLYLEEGWNTFTLVFEGKSPKNTNDNARIDFDFFELKRLDSDITGRNLTVGQDLSVTYYADVDTAVIGDYSLAMQFAMKTTYGKEISEIVASTYDENAGTYSFRFEHVAPQVIAEDINASLVLVDGENNIVKTLDTYTDSVKKYLVSLAESDKATAELKTLISDLLVYGQASKDYLNATAIKDIVDDEIKAKDWFKASETAIPETKMEASTSTGNSKFVTAGVRVGNINKLYFIFTADAEKTVTVKVGDKTLEATDRGNGMYIVYTDGISAIKQDTKVTAELQENGTTVQTLEISINDYAYAMKDDATAGAAITALYRYGASAAAYASSVK